MIDNIKSPKKGLIFITEMNDLGDKYWSKSHIEHLITLIIHDLQKKSMNESQEYLEEVFYSIPPSFFPILLDLFTQNIDGEISKKIISYLLRTNRPIYQIKALNIIVNQNSENFVPFVIPLIFSSYIPLQKQAIKTIIAVPGSAELILEQMLNDRSKKRQKLALKILKRINPANHKLSLKLLESEDFVDRINGIKFLTESNESKWIKSIEIFLEDPDIAVRKAAIEGISKLGGKKAKDILIAQLDYQNYPPLRKILDTQIEKLREIESKR